MAKKKKPVPGSKKKPQPAGRKTPPQAGKKPQPTSKKTPPPAAKKPPQPAGRKTAARQENAAPKLTNTKKQKRAKPSAPKARADGKEIVRRIGIVLLALVMAFSVVLAILSIRDEMLQRRITLQYSGVLQRDCIFEIKFSPEEVQGLVQATKRYGQTNKFTYFCNKTLQISPYSLSGVIYFGNPADNDCTLVLTIFDKNGSQIYRSGGVEPGYYITQISPYVELASGDHACTAYVTAFAGPDQDYKCIGVQYSNLTVKMGEAS